MAPRMEEYEGKIDPQEHLAFFNATMKLQNMYDAIKYIDSQAF